ncbi:hypothetical protein OROGR_028655 [Orobanche gracilis]
MDLEKHEKVLMEYVMRSEEMEKKEEEEEDDDEMDDMIHEMSPEKKKKKREWKDIVIPKEIVDLFPASFYPNTTIHPSRFLKKKAVLIGLKPSNNAVAADVDVKQQILRMKDQLIKLRGFTEEGITLMIEDDENSIRPTATNIRIKLCWLTENTNPGDIVFVHLIAYGCMEGFICTADRHHISDRFFRAVIFTFVTQRLNLTFVSDCRIEPAVECPQPAECHHPLGITDLCAVTTDGNPSIDIRYMGDTNLSPVDILNPTPDNKKTCTTTTQEDDDDDDASPCVVLLIPFHDQNATARELHCFRPNAAAATTPTREEDDKEQDSFDDDLCSSPTTQEEEDGSFGDELCSSPTAHEDEDLSFGYFLNTPELFFTSPKEGTLPTSYGGFTNAVLEVIEETHGQVTYVDLAQKAMKKLDTVPGLSCSHPHHAHASFLC